MLHRPMKAEQLADLRSRAARRLYRRPAPESAASGATDALAVLHTLASSPATAADALALLHELQVHQVELELQAEELNESCAELESQLHRQRAVYDHLPVACMTVDQSLLVLEMNRAAARMVGLEQGEARGLPLATFVADSMGQTLHQLTARIAAGADHADAPLQLRSIPARPVMLRIGAGPDRQGFLVVLSEAAAAAAT